MPQLTNSLEFLGKTVHATMDRPLGSAHPKHGWSYPINYGFVSNTLAADGKELNVYVLGVDAPLESFIGECIAVIRRTNDDDDKLVLVPSDFQMSDDDIRAATHFQEQYFTSEIVRCV